MPVIVDNELASIISELKVSEIVKLLLILTISGTIPKTFLFEKYTPLAKSKVKELALNE